MLFSVNSIANSEYDILVGDITISNERLKIVDFSVPIETSDAIIYMKKSKKKKSNTFSFLLPFSIDVWIGILVCLLLGILNYFIKMGLTLKLVYASMQHSKIKMLSSSNFQLLSFYFYLN